MTILLFFIILGSLVFVHELGHFLVAKWSGIRVDEFALGFPPKIIGKKMGETVYNLNLVPFGGYVKIFGDDADVMSDMAVSESDKARSFIAKPRYIQALVLVSGVFGNIVFAWLLLSAGFISGIPSAIDGRYAADVTGARLTITTVLPGSPAEKAGLHSGDAITSIDEGGKRFADSDADQAGDFIAGSKGELLVSYIRGEESGQALVEPVAGIVEGKPAIGVGLDTVGVVRFGFFRSFYEGALMTADLFREVATGLLGFLKQAILGQASLSAVTGPVGIAGMVGEARILGIVYLLSFTAFISINLAVINLLPIPALDGGRLLFLAIEGIIRRPISVKFTRVVNTTGFVLLILFMLFITYRDIAKLVSS